MTNPDNVGGLPELPKEAAGYMRGCHIDLQEGDLLFTAAQMYAYGELCRTNYYRSACRRPTHHVHRGPESLPCYCAGTSDHPIGQEIAKDSAPAGSGEVEESACDCCGLRIEDEAKLRDAVSTLADFNPGADEFSEALQTLANARFPSQTSPDQSGQVEGLIGEWSADAANLRRNGANAPWFDQGQASALERCADNLRAALLRKLQQGADYEPAFWNVRKDGKHLILFPLNGAVTITTYLEMVAGAHPGAAIDAETLYRAASPRKEAFNG